MPMIHDASFLNCLKSFCTPPWVTYKHEASFLTLYFERKISLHPLMTVHVRWPAKNSGVPHDAGFLAALFFVSFFWASKRKKEKTFAFYRNVFKLLYFLCLEAKKVTKKIQGQTNGSARLSGPTHMKSHYNLKILFAMHW
jgi:hypothetical protein